jgi:predicted transposase/invertase (TIGR01784 family)
VKPGRFEGDRTTIFDLYCKTKNGENILIEMQNARQEYFKDRTLYYASRLIQEQGEDKTGKDWDFKLSSVYSVNIVDFWLTDKKSSDGKYISYVQLCNVKTRKIFHDRLTFVFLELPCFTKEAHELKGIVEQWMYVLKNLSKLNDLPDALRTRIFERLFLKAEIAKLSKEDRKDYDQSLKNYRDMYSVLAERDRKIEALQANFTSLQTQNAAKDQRIAELERLLGLSDTSAKN